MKKYIVLPWISAFLLFNGFSMLSSPAVKSSWFDLVESIFMIIVGLFGLYQGVSAAWSIWKGDPIKDELTRKIFRRAASVSFRISIWCWIVLMIADRHLSKPHANILETGILMMFGVYIISIMVIKIRGLRDE